MFRHLMLSTVFRNVPDQGGGAPVAKPDDAPAAAAAPAPAADGAPAAAAVDPAAAPAAPADGGAAAPAADGAGDLAAAAPAAAEAPKGEDKDFQAETLLTGEEPKAGDAPKAAPTDGDKPAEEKAAVPGEDGAKPAEGDAKEGEKAPGAPPAPAVAPVYEYEFPEDLKIEAETLKPVNEVFAKHGVTPEAAKEFMGLHVNALKSYAEQVQTQSLETQRDVWARTRGMWREEIQSDEQLGGAGYQTTLAQSAEVRDRLVPKERMAAFNRMLLVTGVGDHPEFIRLMKSAHRFVGEGSVPAQQGNPSPNNGQPGGRRRLRDTYAKPA